LHVAGRNAGDEEDAPAVNQAKDTSGDQPSSRECIEDRWGTNPAEQQNKKENHCSMQIRHQRICVYRHFLTLQSVGAGWRSWNAASVESHLATLGGTCDTSCIHLRMRISSHLRRFASLRLDHPIVSRAATSSAPVTCAFSHPISSIEQDATVVVLVSGGRLFASSA